MSASVLFVCLGNICRSPLAEASFRREAERLGLEVEVDSAGMGDWHVGKGADARAIYVAAKNGVELAQFRARQVTMGDFATFDHIEALDKQVLGELRRLRPPGSGAELSLLLDHVEGREGESVADPYYGRPDQFEVTWADVTAGSAGLARRLAGAP